jgi:hypothetical protein
LTGGARVAREIEMLLRNYLRYLLEREIRSAAWLDTLRNGRISVRQEGA